MKSYKEELLSCGYQEVNDIDGQVFNNVGDAIKERNKTNSWNGSFMCDVVFKELNGTFVYGIHVL